MTRTIPFLRIIRVAAIALALATTAGPASARTFDFNQHGSLVQGSFVALPSASNSPKPDAPSGGIEWGYVALASSSAALALIAIATGASGRRRRRPKGTVATRPASARTGNHRTWPL